MNKKELIKKQKMDCSKDQKKIKEEYAYNEIFNKDIKEKQMKVFNAIENISGYLKYILLLCVPVWLYFYASMFKYSKTGFYKFSFFVILISMLDKFISLVRLFVRGKYDYIYNEQQKIIIKDWEDALKINNER